MSTPDTFLRGLRGCRTLDDLTDDEVDRVWTQASAAYGPRLKRSAVRALLLAEGRGWLRKEPSGSPDVDADEPPSSPLANAVARARARHTSPARVPTAAGVLAVPEAVLAHALSFLQAFRVQHRAAATCRTFAAASRSPLAYSAFSMTAAFLAVLGRRGWWLFPPRRPQRLSVHGCHPHAGRVLGHVSHRVEDVRADAGTLSLIPPQTALTTLHCWDAVQSDVVRVVPRPHTLRTLHMNIMRLVCAEDGRWWSSANHLRDLHVRTCVSADPGVSSFAGFPAIRSLVVGAHHASDQADIGAVAAMLRATPFVRTVTVQAQLLGASRPPPLECAVGSVEFASDHTCDVSLRLLRLMPLVRHVSFACRDAPRSPSLSAVFCACAGRVTRSLTVMLNMDTARVGEAPTIPDVALLRQHRLSLEHLCVRLDYQWVLYNVDWLQHCLRLGRNVELRLTGASPEPGAVASALGRVAPLFQWREVSMAPTFTHVGGMYFNDES